MINVMTNDNGADLRGDAILNNFRNLADAMLPEGRNWQWIGPHMSQRYFGITEAAARANAARYGGTASPLVSGSADLEDA